MAKDFGGAQQGQSITSATGMAQFAGTPASRPAAQTARLRIPANANFDLVYYPLRWQFIRATGEWLPNLGRLVFDPGVNGVDRSGDPTLAMAHKGKKGGTIIRQEWSPNGSHYVQAIPALGGSYHCTIWEHPRMVGSTVMESEVDSEGYYTWLRSLISTGRIPAPEPIVLEMLISRYRTKLDSMEKAAHSPGMADKLAKERVYLATMGEHQVLDRPMPSRIPDEGALRDTIAELTKKLAALEAAQAPAPKPSKARASEPTS